MAAISPRVTDTIVVAGVATATVVGVLLVSRALGISPTSKVPMRVTGRR